MKKRILTLLLALVGLAAPLHAQNVTIWNMNYDLASTSYIYCKSEGPFLVKQGTLADISSSTTVTSTGGVFTSMAAGDVIIFEQKDIAPQVRTIATWTNANSITVSSAVTLTGATTVTRWYDVTCGTAATNGWMDGACTQGLVQVDLDTINAASIDVQVEGRSNYPGAEAGVLLNVNYTAVDDEFLVITERGLGQVRIGAKVNTDAGAQNLSIIYTCYKEPL